MKLAHRRLKNAVVIPLIKELNALTDTENFKNYRPVSNLLFVRKSIERIVATTAVTAGIEITKIHLIGRFTCITDTARPHYRLRPRGKILKMAPSDCFKSTCFYVLRQLIPSKTFDLSLYLTFTNVLQ